MQYLYDFSLYSKPFGGTLIARWTHTSAAQAIERPEYPGLVFTPLDGLTHSQLRYDSEKSSGQLTTTAPRDFALAGEFLAGYPYGAVRIRIIEVDDDTPFVVYTGTVRSCNFSEQLAELLCTNGSEALQRLGLRLNAGRQCQWALYSTRCGLDEATYTRTGVVLSISADGLTVETTLAEADNWFKAGKLRARGQARMVTTNTAGTLTLFSAIPGLAPGDAVSASKGCDRSTSTATGCRSFSPSNILRFSGFEGFVTPKNIFNEGA